VKSTRFACQILVKLEFSRYIFENYSNFVKIRVVGAELFHAKGLTDGQADRQT